MYESKKKHPNVKALFALVMESVNRTLEIDRLCKTFTILQDNAGLDQNLAFILICELLWGKGTLAGESRPVKTIQHYQKRLQSAVKNDQQKSKSQVANPRYARVNLLKTNLREVLRTLAADDFYEVKYDIESTTYKEYLSLVKSLEVGQFVVDYHIENLLVFATGTHFYDYHLYLNGSIILQDKASCFPVAALQIKPGCVALDACSAPGMKTSQLAAAVEDGRVIAIERDFKRCQTLKKVLSDCGANENVTVRNCDFLATNPEEFQDVEYIVVDPSCSGTGMTHREGTSNCSEDRLAKLAEMQIKILSHALAFPNVKRVAYSTCSVTEEENEKVKSKLTKIFAKSICYSMFS